MTWKERLAVGESLEVRVASALKRRGWAVDHWGQGILSPRVRDALAASRSRFGHFPDLVAARRGEVVTVDAKDRMWSTPGNRYAVRRTCVSFGLQFLAAFDIPLYYVFGNFGVLTPSEAQAYGSLAGRTAGGAYYLIPGGYGHRFDHVFGAAEARVGVAA